MIAKLPQPVPPSAVPDDATCVRCGYLLRGLEPLGRCPECGLEIDRTLTAHELRCADPLWVRRLADGVFLSIVALLVSVVMELCLTAMINWNFPWTPETYFYYYCVGIAAAADWLGVWLLTLPMPRDPAEPPNPARATVRRALRLGVTVVCAVRLIELSYPFTPVERAARLTSDILEPLVIVLFFVHLRRIAFRLPDVTLIRHLPVVMSGMLLVVVLQRWVPRLSPKASSGVGLGTLLWWVFTVYDIALLWHAYQRLRGAAVESATEGNGKVHVAAHLK